jgi:hypothetical protein
MLKAWVTHYNGARPHMALGPGVPEPPVEAHYTPTRNPGSSECTSGGVRPLGAGRLASGIFARARTGLIEYLRITGKRLVQLLPDNDNGARLARDAGKG